MSYAIPTETHQPAFVNVVTECNFFSRDCCRNSAPDGVEVLLVRRYTITSPICSLPLGLFSCRIKDEYGETDAKGAVRIIVGAQ